MKAAKKIVFVSFSLLCLFTVRSNGEVFDKFKIPAGFSIGYSWGLGLNMGISADLIFCDLLKGSRGYNAGISGGIQWLHRAKKVHKIYTLSLLAENDYLNLKVGYGAIGNPFRFTGDPNQNSMCGLNVDLSAHYKDKLIPSFGVRSFIYDNKNWLKLKKKPITTYTKLQFILLQTSMLRDPE